MKIVVVGAHLSGMPLNHQLTDRGGTLTRLARTAAAYRLYALAGTAPPKPGMIRVRERVEMGIEVEVWEMEIPPFGQFVAEVPPPLCIGTIELEDGELVKGFLVEPYAVSGATEITQFGGWRNYLRQGR